MLISVTSCFRSYPHVLRLSRAWPCKVNQHCGRPWGGTFRQAASQPHPPSAESICILARASRCIVLRSTVLKTSELLQHFLLLFPSLKTSLVLFVFCGTQLRQKVGAGVTASHRQEPLGEAGGTPAVLLGEVARTQSTGCINQKKPLIVVCPVIPGWDVLIYRE